MAASNCASEHYCRLNRAAEPTHTRPHFVDTIAAGKAADIDIDISSLSLKVSPIEDNLSRIPSNTSKMVEAQSCATCGATDTPLQQCARCKSVRYCNKDCQKAHWKTHKKSCAKGGNQSQPGTHTDERPFPAGEQDKKPFTAISKNKFLHDRSQEQTLQLLIDILRLHQEEEYTVTGKAMTGTIYDQQPSSENAFRDFIYKAQTVSGLLPPWWNEKSLEDCLAYSRETSAFALCSAQKKHDIQKTWSDDRMHLKLRLVAERVYGYSPGGFSNDSLLGIMTMAENGDNAIDFQSALPVDLAALFKGATFN